MKTLKYIAVILASVAVALMLSACKGCFFASGSAQSDTEMILVSPSPYYIMIPGYYTYGGGAFIWIRGTAAIPRSAKKRYVAPQQKKVEFKGIEVTGNN